MTDPDETFYVPFPVDDDSPRASVNAFWRDHSCALYKWHNPQPVMVGYCYQKPVFLQKKLYDKVLYGPSVWFCGNCHDAVLAWLYHLLGIREEPPVIGSKAKREAEKTYDWYVSECLRLR